MRGLVGYLLRQSGWTSSMDIFFKWLSAINFGGGGFSEAAVAEALAEALMVTILTSFYIGVQLGFYAYI